MCTPRDARRWNRYSGEWKISLSVEEGNPARKLYEKCGFADAGGNTDPGTMVLEL